MEGTIPSRHLPGVTKEKPWENLIQDGGAMIPGRMAAQFSELVLLELSIF